VAAQAESASQSGLLDLAATSGAAVAAQYAIKEQPLRR